MDLEFLKSVFKRTHDWYRMEKQHFIRVCNGDIEGVINLARKNEFYIIETDYGNDGSTLISLVPVELLQRCYHNYYQYRPYMLTPEAPFLRSANNSAMGIRMFRHNYYDSKCGNGRKFWEHDLYDPRSDHENIDRLEISFVRIELMITEAFIEQLLIRKWGDAGAFSEKLKVRKMEAEFQRNLSMAISRSKSGIAFQIGKKKDDAEDDAGDPYPEGVAEGASLTVASRAPGGNVRQEATIGDIRDMYQMLAGGVANNVAYTAARTTIDDNAAIFRQEVDVLGARAPEFGNILLWRDAIASAILDGRLSQERAYLIMRLELRGRPEEYFSSMWSSVHRRIIEIRRRRERLAFA